MSLDLKLTEDITEPEDIERFLKLLEENDKNPGREKLEPPKLDHLFEKE